MKTTVGDVAMWLTKEQFVEAVAASPELEAMVDMLNGECGATQASYGLALIHDEELYRLPRAIGEPKTKTNTQREHTPSEITHQLAKRFMATQLILRARRWTGKRTKGPDVPGAAPPLLYAPRTDVDGYVYFIQAGVDGPIKIGWSRQVKSRAATIQSWEPVRLVPLATLRGPVATEQALHRRFGSLRLHGEWFRPDPVLLAYIKSIKEPA